MAAGFHLTLTDSVPPQPPVLKLHLGVMSLRCTSSKVLDTGQLRSSKENLQRRKQITSMKNSQVGQREGEREKGREGEKERQTD